MWGLLNNKALTWDIFRKRGWARPGRCTVCIKCEESNDHLIMGCDFAKKVWAKVEVLPGFKNVWRGIAVEEGFRKWLTNPQTKSYKALMAIMA